jgi:murein tripeptide amidase MpaA
MQICLFKTKIHRQLLLAIIISCILVLSSFAEKPQMIYKLKYSSAQKMEALRIIKELDSRAPEFNPIERYVIVYLSQKEVQTYTRKGFRLEKFAEYDLLHSRTKEYPDRGIAGYPCYRTVAETFASAEAIVQNYPQLAVLKDVGDSYRKATDQGGEDMLVLVLTNRNIQIAKPPLFILGGIHAREYVTCETLSRFAEYLVGNYGIDADITWILDYHEIHLMLQTNPDGRKMADTTTAQILWRKNCHMHDNNFCSDNSSSQIGVDLNRNFPFYWSGSSSNVCSLTYPGKTAASEPETQAVRDYYMQLFTDYNATPNTPAPDDAEGIFIDLHSYTGLILWPWGYTSTDAPNQVQLRTLSRKLAFFNNYKPLQTYDLYQVRGGSIDDCYAELGIPSICFEMGTAFFQDCQSFENTIYPDNLQSLLYAAKACRAPYRVCSGPDVLEPSINDNVLSALISDDRYSNQNGTEPSQSVAAAEYYIDIPPWNNGIPVNMIPTDGHFDNIHEIVAAQINLSDLSGGRHIVFVRGQDADGNWGAVSAVFLNINRPPRAYFTAKAQGTASLAFTDYSEDADVSDKIVSWHWDFGDNTYSSEQHPAHIYQPPYYRSYKVTLTVTDQSGAAASFYQEVSFTPNR